MSRKGKKRAKAKYRQPMRPAGPLTPSAGSGGAAGTSAPTRTVQQARAGGDSAMVVLLVLGSVTVPLIVK